MFTFETLDCIQYYRDDPTILMDLKRDFLEKNPDSVCRVGVYHSNGEANIAHQKFCSEMAKLPVEKQKDHLDEVVVLDDGLVGGKDNDEDDDETVYSAIVDNNHEEKECSQKKDDKMPATVTPTKKFDLSQLDNHHGIYYVLFTLKEQRSFPSLVECQMAFEEYRKENSNLPFSMLAVASKLEADQKYGEFLAKKNTTETSLQLEEKKDHRCSIKMKPAAPRIANPYSAGRSSIMPASRRAAVYPDSATLAAAAAAAVTASAAPPLAQFQPRQVVSFEGGSFRVDSLLIKLFQTKYRLDVHVLHPGHFLRWDVDNNVETIMFVLDLKQIVRFSFLSSRESPSHWLFKPSIFHALKHDGPVSGVLAVELFNALNLNLRAQPFGTSRPMLHENRNRPGNPFEHELLAIWVKKENDVPIHQQVENFLAKVATDIMSVAFQEHFYTVSSILHPNKLYQSYKPLNQLKSNEVNQSFWVHFFAGLKKPNIMYSNRLRDILLDEDILQCVPRFFPSQKDMPPKDEWNSELLEFAYGEEDVITNFI